MLSLRILGSGSAGNAALLTTDHCRILIDAGFSARSLVERLGRAGCTPEELSAIVLTHEHGDHTRGLEVFCKKFAHLNIPIYVNNFTAAELRSGGCHGHAKFHIYETGQSFELCDVRIHTFSVPHDAVDPVGFVFEHVGGSIGYLTDLGHATKSVIERVRGVHTLVIETNYDRELLLQDTKRPWPVKQRIMNRHGHLSNEAACEVLTALAPLKHLRQIIVGHLSLDCNTPERALNSLRKRLGELNASHVDVYCACQKEVSPAFIIGEDFFPSLFSTPPPAKRTAPVRVAKVA